MLELSFCITRSDHLVNCNLVNLQSIDQWIECVGICITQSITYNTTTITYKLQFHWSVTHASQDKAMQIPTLLSEAFIISNLMVQLEFNFDTRLKIYSFLNFYDLCTWIILVISIPFAWVPMWGAVNCERYTRSPTWWFVSCQAITMAMYNCTRPYHSEKLWSPCVSVCTLVLQSHHYSSCSLQSPIDQTYVIR
jgi:hypothetical protein